MNPPVLHHTHRQIVFIEKIANCMMFHRQIVFIEKIANCMMFRGNARIFSIQTRSWTAILGWREYSGSAFYSPNKSSEHCIPNLLVG